MTADRPLEQPSESDWEAENAPRCPRCSAVLSDTMAVKTLMVTVDEEPADVKVAYCSRCGAAIGTVS